MKSEQDKEFKLVRSTRLSILLKTILIYVSQKFFFRCSFLKEPFTRLRLVLF